MNIFPSSETRIIHIHGSCACSQYLVTGRTGGLVRLLNLFTPGRFHHIPFERLGKGKSPFAYSPLMDLELKLSGKIRKS